MTKHSNMMTELALNFSPACASDVPTLEPATAAPGHQREAGYYFRHHRTSPHARCAVCIYLTGLGAKATAKILPISYSGVLRAVKVVGVLDEGRHKFRNLLRTTAADRNEKQRQIVLAAEREEKKKQRALLAPIKREKSNKRALEYYHSNKTRFLQRMRDTSKARYNKLKSDKEFVAKRKQYHLKWNEENKEYKADYQRKWIAQNPAKYKAAQRRIRQTPKYKMISNLRRRLRDIVKGRKYYSIGSAINFVGCTSDELRAHIEAQWIEGMTWDNYGEWHVDHILPCAAFDLTDKELVKICFHYSNLQPLWAEDNLLKSDSVDHTRLTSILNDSKISRVSTDRYFSRGDV